MALNGAMAASCGAWGRIVNNFRGAAARWERLWRYAQAQATCVQAFGHGSCWKTPNARRVS